MIVELDITKRSNQVWYKNPIFMVILIITILGIFVFLLPIIIVYISSGENLSPSWTTFISSIGLFSVSATLFLVSITAYYSYATKKMADSTQQNAELTQKNINNTKDTIKVMNETKWHQVITDIQSDYRSPQMMLAISEVWNFYRKCEDEYKEKHLKMDFTKYVTMKFMRKYHKEKKEIDNGQDIKSSLNFYRRELTHFYFHVAILYVHGIIPKNLIFDWWMPNDLVIIDKVLLPCHEALKKEISSLKKGFSEKELYVFKKYLRTLVDDCEEYYNNLKIT
jgi:hypothetical protein